MIIPELGNGSVEANSESPENTAENTPEDDDEDSYESPDTDEEIFPLDSDVQDYDVLEEKVPCYIVTREEWGAKEPKGATELVHPLPDVLFTYTNSDPCDGWEDCVNFMKKEQQRNMEEEGMPDIQYNYYIAKDWTVYEGCGWHHMASNIKYYPKPENIFTICYIGRYEGQIYPSLQVRSVMDTLLELGVERGYIKEDFDNLPILI